MGGRDAELIQLRAGVSCALLLERSGYRLDERESTRNCQKWRRGSGEIVIVNHGGRGWWDPRRAGTDRAARGDVFTLGQHLNPGINLGQVRRLLRGMMGLVALTPAMERGPVRAASAVPVAQRWAARRALSRGSPTWAYLTRQRALPACVLEAASAIDGLREDPRGTAWFAHRDHAGVLTGIDMRGPDWRGFAAGTTKTLFRLPGSAGRLSRLAVCEAPIDALSLAAIEGLRRDTLYVSTTGGMGPETIGCLDLLLAQLTHDPDGVLDACTDADTAGTRYALHLESMAQAAGVRYARSLPGGGLNDWNDVLRARELVS